MPFWRWILSLRFCCLIFTVSIFPITAEKIALKKDAEQEVLALTYKAKSKKEVFFQPFFNGLEKLGIQTKILWQIVNQLNSTDVGGFSPESDMLGGFGVGAYGLYTKISLNPRIGSGIGNFNKDGDLEELSLIHPKMASVVIHEFWHAYRHFFLDNDDQNPRNLEVYKEIKRAIREDGLDERVRAEGNLSGWKKFTNTRLTDEQLLEKFAEDYSNEAVAFLLGSAMKGILGAERQIIEANFQKGLTKAELRFILDLKDDAPIPANPDRAKLETFILPTYLSFSLNFNKYSDGIFIPFGKQGLAPNESRDFNVNFVKDLETWDEPYYYSGFKNWSAIRPKGGAVKVREEHGVYALKNFVSLNMPTDLKELVNRMNSEQGYQDLRLQLARRRSAFAGLLHQHDQELKEDNTEFLNLNDITRTGGH